MYVCVGMPVWRSGTGTVATQSVSGASELGDIIMLANYPGISRTVPETDLASHCPRSEQASFFFLTWSKHLTQN